MALISVIVPVYNAEQYLEECLNSIVNQTLRDIEIILINDGSSDLSLEICTQFARIDHRVCVYTIKNGGVSNARNIGLDYSSSDYIHFVDADDFLEPTILEELYTPITQDNYDFSMCGYFKEEIGKGDDSRKIKYNCQDFEGTIEQFLENIIQYYYPPIIQGPCWKLFKRSIIIDNNIKFDRNMDYGEDLDFVLNYLKSCSFVFCINKCLYYYRVHGNTSLSKKLNENKLDTNIDLAKKLEVLEKMKLNYHTGHSETIIGNCFISYLTELTSFKKTMGLNRMVEIIKYSIEIKDLKISLQYLKNQSLKYFLYYLFIKFKSPLILIFITEMKVKLRSYVKG